MAAMRELAAMIGGFTVQMIRSSLGPAVADHLRRSEDATRAGRSYHAHEESSVRERPASI